MVTPEVFSSIIKILESHPEGMKVIDLANILNMNRNAVAKYLEILHQQGQVDKRHIGTAKIYTVSKRVPFQILEQISQDIIIGINRNMDCIAANSRFYEWDGSNPEKILGKPFHSLSSPILNKSQVGDMVMKCFSTVSEPVRISHTLHNNCNYYEIRCMPTVFEDSTTGTAIIIKDITKSETAADEISLWKERYQAVTDAQSEYIIHSLPEGIITYINPAFAELAGISPDKLIGKRFHLPIPIDDDILVRQHFHSIQEDKPEKSIEHRVLSHSGGIRWIRWKNRGIFKDGNLIEYHSHGIDITELKLARNRLQYYHENTEAMIREKTEELQKINYELLTEIKKRKQTERNLQKTQFSLNNSSEMILWTDKEGIITSLNKSAMDRFGSLSGKNLQFINVEYSAAEELIPWHMIWEPAKEAGYVMFETKIPDKNEKLFYAEVLGNFLYYDDIEHCCLFIRDITIRKQAMEAVSKSEQKYREIFNNVSDSLFVFDVTEGYRFQFIGINPCAENLIGVSGNDVTGKFLDEIEKPEYLTAVLPNFHRCLESGESLRYEEEYTNRDGCHYFLDTTIIPVQTDNGEVKRIVKVSLDITLRKRAELELFRKNKALRILTHTNQALIHITDESELMHEICRIIVEIGDYRMAWIGFKELDENKSIRPVAHAGFESGYIKSANLTWADTERGWGPGGVSVRTGQISIVRNTLTDPVFLPMRSNALLHGFNSVIGLPLTNEEQTFGTLLIYCQDVDGFDTTETEILKEMADDLAFGITSLRIKDRKKEAELALTESEKRYRLLVEHSPDAVFVHTTGIMMYVNPAGIAMLGAKSADEILGRSAYDFVHPDFHDMFRERIQTLSDNKEYSGLVEEKLVRLDGTEIFAEVANTTITYRGEKSLQVIVRDITDRKKAERLLLQFNEQLEQQVKIRTEELIESQRNYRDLVENINEVIISVDLQANLTYVSPLIEKVAGYSPDELIGRNFMSMEGNLIHRDDFPAIIEAFKHNLTNECITSEWRLITRDGEIIYIVSTPHPNIKEGIVTGFNVILTNITDRKKIEIALQKNEMQLASAMDIAQIVKWEFDVASNLFTFDDQFYSLYGTTAIRECGYQMSWNRYFQEFMYPDDANTIDIANNNLQNPSSDDAVIEHRIIRRDGEIRNILVRYKILRDTQGNIIKLFGANQDITDRKRSEEAVQAAVKLNQLIDTMSVSECMSFTLDEAERLTSSKIGFFHLVNPDEQTIRMVAFSTETRKHCFIPKEPEQYYPVEKAGVWVDCLRERKPVIHNDYASLSHKKGLPEGHVPIIKELVVPVFDEDRIVALIGVGNKAVDYNEKDINVLTLLAKNVWTLIQRKQAEEKIEKAQQEIREHDRFLQRLIDTIPSPIFYKNKDGIYTGCNAAFEEFYGFPRDHLVGKTVYDIWPKDLADIYYTKDQAILEKIGTQVYESRLTYTDGSIHDVIFNKASFTDLKGNVDGLVGVILDINERKQMEEALLKKTAMFEAQVESSYDGILIISEKNERILINQRLIDMWRIPADILKDSNDEPLLQYVVRQVKYPELFLKKVMNLYSNPEVSSQDIVEFLNGRVYDRYSAPVIDNTGYYHGRIWTFRDITERKQMEEALRLSENHLQTLVNTLPDLIFLKDGDGVYISCNSSFEQFFGVNEAELIGKTDFEIYSREMAEHFRKHDRIAMETGTSHQYEEWIISAEDGRDVLVDTIKTPMYNNEGKFIGVLGIARDITERKQMEEELFNSHQMLQLILDTIPHRIFWKDRNSVYIGCNLPFARDGGLEKPEDIIGKDDYDLGWAEQADMYREDDRNVMESGISKLLFEELQTTPSGKKIHLLTSKVPLKDINGNIIGILGMYMNITEKKEAEEALRVSEQRYREIFDNVSESIYLLEVTEDDRFKNLEVNLALEKSVGIAKSDLIGKYVDETVSPEAGLAVVAKYRRCVESGKTYEEEIELRLPNGNHIFHSSLVPLRNKEGRIDRILGITHDITERKQMEEELFKSHQMLQIILDTIPQRVFWKDRNSVYLGCNKSLALDIGYSNPDEVVGITDYETPVSKEIVEVYRDDDRQVMETGLPKLCYEEPHIKPDGSQAWLLTNKVPLRDINGNIIGVLGTYEDITYRKRKEQEIPDKS